MKIWPANGKFESISVVNAVYLPLLSLLYVQSLKSFMSNDLKKSYTQNAYSNLIGYIGYRMFDRIG